MTLTVDRITQGGTGLVLWVSLRNEGPQPVEFLYSFVEVRDSNHQPLRSLVESLPTPLPNNRQGYTGRIELLESSAKGFLSLRLANYPDETLELSLPRIPLP